VDWRDFVRPHGFTVRYYRSDLSYTCHNVLPFKTSSPNHLIYKVMRSADKINLWLTEDDIVSQLDVTGYRNYLHYPKSCGALEVICGTLSQRGVLVVSNDESSQPGLF